MIFYLIALLLFIILLGGIKMAATLTDVQAGLTAVQQTVTLLNTDVQALIAKGTTDLTPVVAALGALNTALTQLDDAVKAALAA